MKIFLFLYPIREYVDACLDQTFFLQNGYKPERFGRLIDARYRKRGYNIVWVLFSDQQDVTKPDLSQISEIFQIKQGDQIISCGVSFELHCSKWIYPDPKGILSHLPDGIEELAVGGFHQWDCVDKIARCAYDNGTPTRVDEDTTQFFFHITSTEGQIPFIRRRSTLRKSFARFGEHWVELARKSRKAKPWFEQLT